jgi:hypothetical protein
MARGTSHCFSSGHVGRTWICGDECSHNGVKVADGRYLDPDHGGDTGHGSTHVTVPGIARARLLETHFPALEHADATSIDCRPGDGDSGCRAGPNLDRGEDPRVGFPEDVRDDIDYQRPAD